MTTLDLPVPGTTPDYPTTGNWAQKINDALTALNNGKVEAFADPGADRIVFWDDSASAWVALSFSAPLSITGTVLSVAAASETAAGIVELATTAEATTGTDTARAVTPAGLKTVADTKAASSHTHTAAQISDFATAVPAAVPAATATAQGAVELATTAEATAGTDTTRAITAAGLLATRGLYVGVNAQTGTSYTPVLTDQGKLVTLSNAAAIAVSLPQDSAVAFPIGAWIDFLIIGAGSATFGAGTGATVNGATLVAPQWRRAVAIKRAANTWTIDIAAPSGASGIPESLINAKGDLLVGLADDSVTRLQAGTNGQVLSADSAEVTGLKWIPAPSGGGGVVATAIPAIDEWVPSPFITAISAAAKIPGGPPIYFPYMPGTYDATLLKITTIGGVGDTITIRLLEVDPTNFRPSTTVISTVVYDPTAVGIITKLLDAPISIPADGLYIEAEGSASVARVWGVIATGGPTPLIGTDTVGGRSKAMLEGTTFSTAVALRRLT
jgi:hypothetical protein